MVRALPTESVGLSTPPPDRGCFRRSSQLLDFPVDRPDSNFLTSNSSHDLVFCIIYPVPPRPLSNVATGETKIKQASPEESGAQG